MSWQVVGASVIGTSHQEAATPCQDAHQYRLLESGEVILAVADGAGTAARSAEGAALAVKRAVDALEQACRENKPASDEAWSLCMRQCFGLARQAIADLAAQDGSPIRLFATTLTCAVLAETRIVLGQIGDGFAVAQDGHGTLLGLTTPQRGEYANEAAFLTMPQALDCIDVTTQALNAKAVALATDGLLRLALKLPGYTPHPPFFIPLFAFAAGVTDAASAGQQLADFLASDRVCARTDDDKTLVLAASVGPSDTPPSLSIGQGGA